MMVGDAKSVPGSEEWANVRVLVTAMNGRTAHPTITHVYDSETGQTHTYIDGELFSTFTPNPQVPNG